MGESGRSPNWEHLHIWGFRYLARFGGLLLVLGGFAIAAPFLPAQSSAQESTDPRVFVPVGVLAILAGTAIMLVVRRRTGSVFGPSFGGSDE